MTASEPFADDVAREQEELHDDLEVVGAYGAAHEDVWAGVRFENRPRVHLVAGVTAAVDTHAAALQALVEHPDRLVVEQARFSRAELRALQGEVRSLLAARQRAAGRTLLESLGVRGGRLAVGLAATEERLAAELADLFGDVLELQVGALTYPARLPAAGTAVAPEPVPAAIAGLELRLVVPEAIVAGDTARGALQLRNVGAGRVELGLGQPQVAQLLDPRGRVVGGHVGAIAGTGRSVSLEAGEEASLPVLVGTASVVGELGYVLPPGRYAARVVVPANDRRGARGGAPLVLVAPSAPVTVLARQGP